MEDTTPLRKQELEQGYAALCALLSSGAALPAPDRSDTRLANRRAPSVLAEACLKGKARMRTLPVWDDKPQEHLWVIVT